MGLMGGRNIFLSTVKLIFPTIAMASVVYFFNATFFNSNDPLITKLIVLSADIGIGLII